jgi:hypothetical protein
VGNPSYSVAAGPRAAACPARLSSCPRPLRDAAHLARLPLVLVLCATRLIQHVSPSSLSSTRRISSSTSLPPRPRPLHNAAYPAGVGLSSSSTRRRSFSTSAPRPRSLRNTAHPARLPLVPYYECRVNMKQHVKC